MAERLGQAVLELKTDDSKFTKGVGRAKGGADRLDRSFKRTGRAAQMLGRRLALLGGRLRTLSAGFFTMRNAAVAAAGIVGIGLLVKKSLDFADNIAKTADKLGIMTSELQLMRFAADKAGLTQEKFDKSLGFFGKVLGEARTGIGTLRDMLLKVNPALLDQLLATDSITEAFDLMMKVLFETKGATDRLALSSAAFGRSGGQDMINIAKDGGEAWREWIGVAKEFGLVIEDPLLRNAEDAVDQLSFLGDAIKAHFVRAMLEAAPEIARVARELAESVPIIAEWGQTQVHWIRDNVIPAFEALFDVIGIAIGGYEDLFKIVKRFLTTEQGAIGETIKDAIVLAGEGLRSIGIGPERTFGVGANVQTTPMVPGISAGPTPEILNLVGRAATAPGQAIGSGAEINIPIVLNADMEAGMRSVLIQMVPEISEKIIENVRDDLQRNPISGARP